MARSWTQARGPATHRCKPSEPRIASLGGGRRRSVPSRGGRRGYVDQADHLCPDRSWGRRRGCGAGAAVPPGVGAAGLTNGQLEGADYWRQEPAILSAGLGFDNIIGLPAITQDVVHQAGGSWYGGPRCRNGNEPSTGMRTSSAAADTIGQAFKGYADYDDGLPVVFSWPVATETVDPADFTFTLNTGETVFGHAAGMNPNWEHNVRNTVVLFGDFGNRKKSLARCFRSSWRSSPTRPHCCWSGPAVARSARSASRGRRRRPPTTRGRCWSAPSSTPSPSKPLARAASS